MYRSIYIPAKGFVGSLLMEVTSVHICVLSRLSEHNRLHKNATFHEFGERKPFLSLYCWYIFVAAPVPVEMKHI
jgi:hypothetical protein